MPTKTPGNSAQQGAGDNLSRRRLLVVATGVVGAIAASLPAARRAHSQEQPCAGHMNGNERIVRDFIAAWSRLDADELGGYFTDDAVYWNMPIQPVTGRDNIVKFIDGFLAGWTETNWEILNLMAAGDMVMVERVDRTRAGDKAVDLPVFGVFEMKDAKIKEWREYFDFATYMNAMK